MDFALKDLEDAADPGGEYYLIRHPKEVPFCAHKGKLCWHYVIYDSDGDIVATAIVAPSSDGRDEA